MQISPAISLPRAPISVPANQRDPKNADGEQIGRRNQNTQERSAGRSNPESRSGSGRQLSEQEQRTVEELKKRDREVRAHENAHAAAAGALGSAPTYTFKSGPDGRQYAVGGEVKIDSSPVPDDPAATIRKMQQVRRAALAPAEPSAQDRAVANQAARTQASARAELLREQTEELTAGQAESDAGSQSVTNDVERDKSQQAPAIAGAESAANDFQLGADSGPAAEFAANRNAGGEANNLNRSFGPQNDVSVTSAIGGDSKNGATIFTLSPNTEGSPARAAGRSSLLPNVNAIQAALYTGAGRIAGGGNLVDVFA